MTQAVSDNSPVWFVTGASKGIGRDVVQAAAAAGARVVAASRNPEPLTDWAAEQGLSDRILAIALDVTSDESAQAGVQQAVDRFGRIDVLVNNAGYLLYGGIEELSDAEVRRSFDVNVFGLWTVTRAVLPVMRGQRSGHVINMSSISANVTSPGVGLYSATKAAVLMLTEALAEEGAEVGIRATAIQPGGVRTDFLDSSSARRAEKTIDDYTAVHAVEQGLARGNHRQGGDPQLVARAIVEVGNMDEPPSRLYLGQDALASIVRDIEQVSQSIEQYQELSESTTG